MNLHRLRSLSRWDALVVQSAISAAGCSVLLSEDMRHDATLSGVRIENPFSDGRTA